MHYFAMYIIALSTVHGPKKAKVHSSEQNPGLIFKKKKKGKKERLPFMVFPTDRSVLHVHHFRQPKLITVPGNSSPNQCTLDVQRQVKQMNYRRTLSHLV